MTLAIQASCETRFYDSRLRRLLSPLTPKFPSFFIFVFADESLSVPFPPNDIFSKAKNAGAFIHSASWGSSSNGYGSNARAFDDYIYNDKEFLIIVAAGNSGQRGQFNSVGDPATAKNIISGK
jgi:hypothetical protein